MANSKIHIAGPLVGSVQKCLRCKTRIDSNRTWEREGRTPTGWREGALVLSSGRGWSVLDSIAAGIGTRYCGKAGK